MIVHAAAHLKNSPILELINTLDEMNHAQLYL